MEISAIVLILDHIRDAAERCWCVATVTGEQLIAATGAYLDLPLLTHVPHVFPTVYCLPTTRFLMNVSQIF